MMAIGRSRVFTGLSFRSNDGTAPAGVTGVYGAGRTTPAGGMPGGAARAADLRPAKS
jgi:hypothetical protein